MSYDLVLEGGRAVDVNAWITALARMGLRCRFADGFDPITHEGWVPLRCEIASGQEIPAAEEFSADSDALGFEMWLAAIAPDADPAAVARRRARLSARIRFLGAQSAPAVLVERAERELASLETPEKLVQRATIRVPSDSPPGCYVAAIYAAAAYAAAFDATMADSMPSDTMPEGGRWAGAEALEAAPKLAALRVREVREEAAPR